MISPRVPSAGNFSVKTTGRVNIVKRPFRSGAEFAQALFQLAMAYPEAETIHLVMDNLSTHTRKSLTDLCGEEFGGEIWKN